MTHDDPVVAVQDLRCSYGGFEAVRGVTFQVPRGRLFALLGTNGAGKTTTMETLEGHKRPTSRAFRTW
ncbi:MAG: ATP-binding cassette domain-containing protein [Egibacteraceae bacterium]